MSHVSAAASRRPLFAATKAPPVNGLNGLVSAFEVSSRVGADSVVHARATANIRYH